MAKKSISPLTFSKKVIFAHLQQIIHSVVRPNMKRSILALIFLFSLTASHATDTDPLYKLAPVSIRQAQARPDLPGNLKVELGWNFLQDEPAPMAINTFGSRTVNVSYSYELPVGKFGLFFVPGIGIGMDRYKFDADFTLSQNANGDVSFTDITELNPKKSHLITNYVDIPLEFRFYTNPDDRKRSFNISFGGKFGFLFESQTKLKYDDGSETVKVKNKKSYGLNPFRYGLTGRIGYGGFNVFGYFSLSELFEDGPNGTVDTSNFTIGLSVNLF